MKRSKVVRRSFNLPVDCISLIVSLTTTRDACRCSAVSRSFQQGADSDAVWERFLPADWEEIISRSASPELLRAGLSKKNLFFSLCDKPIIINNGTMSFALDRESGKKCYAVGARQLTFMEGENREYWNFSRCPESRFGEVAQLHIVRSFQVKGNMKTNILSPKTTYVAYLVFKFAKYRRGFKSRTFLSGVYLEGVDDWERQLVLLDPDIPEIAQEREGGWLMIELGEFFNENGDDGTLMFILFDTERYSIKRGIFIEGIELRPKNGT